MCIRRVPRENSVALLSDSAESESTLALCFIAFSWCEPVSTSLENALGGGVLPQGTQSKIAAEINPARAVHGPISILAVFSKKRGRLAVTVPSARKGVKSSHVLAAMPLANKTGPKFLETISSMICRKVAAFLEKVMQQTKVIETMSDRA